MTIAIIKQDAETTLGSKPANFPNQELPLNTLGYCSTGNARYPAMLGPMICAKFHEEEKDCEG